MITIRITGPQGSGKTQLAVELTDWLRVRGYRAYSTYVDPARLPRSLRRKHDAILEMIDVLVEDFE